MLRTSTVALLAGVSLAALLTTTDAFGRGGGHFGGGHFGGGHFGGGRFDGGRFDRGFRPEMREHMDRDVRRPEGEHRDEHREEDAARHRDDHDARDKAEAHREDADRGREDRRDLADRDHDLRHPVNNGHAYRNAFWGNQFGARALHCPNCRWGWVGPVFWPFALGDIFAFAWWPYAGTPAFWDYGLNYILTGVFWPYGAYQWPEGYGAYAWSGDDNAYQVARESHQNVYSGGPADGSDLEPQENTSELQQTCSGFAPGVGGLPVDRIAEAVKPNANQQAAFDRLKDAAAKAGAILKSACPSTTPLTPVGRLDALQKRLEAMDQAVDTVMGPFADFSKTLDETQRKALNGLAGSGGGNGPVTEMGDLGGCIDEGQEFIDLPAQEIAQSVKPNAKQDAALDKLENVSAQAAERLRSGCPGSVPATPEARLEAMDQRLHQTLYAVNEVRPALVSFYDSLSDEQKARFNTLPPEQASARP